MCPGWDSSDIAEATMGRDEDIAFFLVGRIEGARERAKAVSALSLSPRK